MRIIIFGDSISEGFWDYERGGWVQRLKTHFWKKYGYENSVIGFAIAAHTSTHLKKYIQVCFEAVSKRQEGKYKESIVIIAIGINDAARFLTSGENQVDFDTFQKNIREISQYLQQETLIKKVIFLGNINTREAQINNPLTATEFLFYNEDIQKYNTFLQENAKAEGYEYIELFGDMNESDLQIDGLHPNACGHEKIFQKIKIFLEKNILSP